LKTHGAAGEAMAAREMRAMWADEACAQPRPLGSIAPSALKHTGRVQIFIFCPFSPFYPQFECKDLQHHKTLKQTKTLEINNAKSLTNIS
jgi:hypothetical protein